MNPLGIVAGFDFRYFYIEKLGVVIMRSEDIERRVEIMPVVGIDRPYFLLALEVLILFDRER